MYTCKLSVLAVLYSVMAAHPIIAETIPGLPYERMETEDSDGDKVTFYVTHPEKPAPLALFIQDSGCLSLVEKGDDGKYNGEIAVFMKRAARDRLTLLAVESPYSIRRSQIPEGKEQTSVGCPKEFLEQDTLEKRQKQLQAAFLAGLSLPWAQPGPILIVGRQDGAIIAARMANTYKSITNLALISESGAPTAWEIMLHESNKNNKVKGAHQINDIMIQDIISNKNSIDKWHGDFTYKYMYSHITSLLSYDVMNNDAAVYVIQLTPGETISISSMAAVTALLRLHGRDITVRNINGFNAIPTESSTKEMTDEYARIIDWFLSKNGITTEPQSKQD